MKVRALPARQQIRTEAIRTVRSLPAAQRGTKLWREWRYYAAHPLGDAAWVVGEREKEQTIFFRRSGSQNFRG